PVHALHGLSERYTVCASYAPRQGSALVWSGGAGVDGRAFTG
ncbi:MAG: hypothetical protein QOE32_6237, partial [Pseudonocardiales bacterium]|nr:hypothetical protein [Pseudonocardiales bacterium]